jgi:hypothetical protein
LGGVKCLFEDWHEPRQHLFQNTQRDCFELSAAAGTEVESGGLIASNNPHRARSGASQRHGEARDTGKIATAGDREHHRNSVMRLKASGETIRTGRCPFCSCPAAGSRPTSQISPRFIRAVKLAVHFESPVIPVLGLAFVKPGKMGPKLRPHAAGPLAVNTPR